jgi:hypothetical protein
MLETQALLDITQKLGRKLSPGETFTRKRELVIGKGMIGQITIPLPGEKEIYGPTLKQNIELTLDTSRRYRDLLSSEPSVTWLTSGNEGVSNVILHTAKGIPQEEEVRLKGLIPGIEIDVSQDALMPPAPLAA